MLRITAVISLLLILFIPADLFAFGPYTHIYYGFTFLHNFLEVANPALFALINRHPNEFYYGNIAADIVFAKNASTYLFHCHNWSTIDQMFDQVRSEANTAFLFGYLTHIVADIVAHNYFVPVKFIESYTSGFRKHLYWEMSFDRRFKEHRNVRDILAGLKRSTTVKEQDRFLRDHMVGTVIRNFNLNKTIFQGLLNVQNLTRMDRMRSLLKPDSKWAVRGREMEEVSAIVFDNLKLFFQEPETSSIREIDPRGIAAVSIAKIIRGELRRLYKMKLIPGDRSAEVREAFAPFFEDMARGHAVKIPDLGDIARYIDPSKERKRVSVVKFIRRFLPRRRNGAPPKDHQDDDGKKPDPH